MLKLLQESYLNKVKMIYIDPPYNTGNDFVYVDNFRKEASESNLENALIDEEGNKLSGLKDNPATAARYHSDWLSMMYPRLKLARNLLSNNGVIFISIDDNEHHNLRRLCDDIFGEHNKLGVIANINNPKGRSDDKFIATAHEYIIVYGKDAANTTVHGFEPDEKITKRYNKEDTNGKKFREIDLRKTGDADRRSDRPDMFYYFYALEDNPNNLIISKEKANHPNRIEIIPLKEDNSDGRWRWGFQTAKDNLDSVYAKFMPTRKIWGIFEKDYLEGRPSVKSTSSWTHKDVNSERGSEQMIELGLDKETFSRPKPLGTLKRVMEIGTLPKEKSIVLDFFSGSAGLCQAMFELVSSGKRDLTFVAVQLPESTPEGSTARKEGFEKITEIARSRISRSAKKIKDETNADIDYGFRVYRLDSSNMQDVYYSPQDYKQSNLDLFADNVKPDRTPDDLLAQVMLDWGLPLSLKIEQISINGKHVFKVAYNSLFACFDKGIDEEFAKAIAKEKPLRIVFRDSSFKNDTAKENVKQLLKQLSPETEMKVV